MWVNLGYAGNYMLYTSSNKNNNNITTCDRDLLAKIANRNGQPDIMDTYFHLLDR